MPTISTTDAQGLFTKMLVDAYKEKSTPTSFLRSFFPDKVTPTLELSIEVQRGYEKIAVDVTRGTDGNRNEFSRSSEKIFIPPYYREYFDATQLQLYDRLYGATEINDAIFAAYINSVAEHQMEIKNKIERRYELQIAEVFQTGIVTLNKGTNIDFKRKAASMVDPGAGNYWANNVNLYDQLETGANFLRQTGKVMGGEFDIICGSEAFSDMQTNTVFLQRQNLFNMALDAIAPPQRNSVGASLHGRLSFGAYKGDIWTYPQFYDHPTTGVSTPYIDPKLVIMLPKQPKFVMGFAAVPQLITPNTAPQIGSYIFGDYRDERNASHIFDVKSAGVAIPTAIDQMYTLRAVAA